MRWWGLGLFALGLVVAVLSGQLSQDSDVRLMGPALGLLGMAIYLASTLIRAFQWRRE
jgi:drug/metabolite transporter (DMT)-like permease